MIKISQHNQKMLNDNRKLKSVEDLLGFNKSDEYSFDQIESMFFK